MANRFGYNPFMAPTTLWHYTDVAGLSGILSSSTLHLGDARCLNDRTERSYGVTVVEQALKTAIAEGDETGLLARVDGYMDHDLSRTDLYLCSFSATSESLSQWQRYGADCRGYCIGFNYD